MPSLLIVIVPALYICGIAIYWYFKYSEHQNKVSHYPLSFSNMKSLTAATVIIFNPLRQYHALTVAVPLGIASALRDTETVHLFFRFDTVYVKISQNTTDKNLDTAIAFTKYFRANI